MHTLRPILMIFSLTLGFLMLPHAASGLAAPSREPKPYDDPADTRPSPLDLISVALGQRGSDLVLRISTVGEWEPSDLSNGSGSALCVRLYYGRLRNPRSQVCVVDGGKNRAGLLYARLDPFGGTVDRHYVGADILRADRRSFEAVFSPTEIRLQMGRYSWRAVSKWACEPKRSCDDHAPGHGNVVARVRPLAEPRCFGAASRGVRPSCSNSALRRAVIPTPEEAQIAGNARCTAVGTREPYRCLFGVSKARAERAVALVGDSHAAHWRGALQVVAQARRWRGYSLSRSGCPLSTAPPDLDRSLRRACSSWRASVLRWFRRNPEIQTLFVSQLAGVGVRAPRGQSEHDYAVRGFMRAWNRLPKSVRQIIVLRDTPITTGDRMFCVEQALRKRLRTDTRCALPRSRALRRDPAADAARRTRNRRVHVFDLSDHMCNRRSCFPVVGGALVHKDTTHLTPIFAATLGPFLLDKVSKLLGGPSQKSFI